MVNIGTRQSGRECGQNVMDVDYSKNQIKNSIFNQIKYGKYSSDQLYGDGKSGERISQLLAETPLDIQKRLAY